MKKSGRPKKHNCDYFSHENGMRNDRKLKAVRAKYDLQGYAIYNMILESLTESHCLVIEWEEMEIEMMAGDFGIDSKLLIEMVEYFEKINLLQLSNGYLFCPQLDNRLKYVFDKRNQILELIRDENGISVAENGVSVTETTRSEVKESEVKERKKKQVASLPSEFDNDSFRAALDDFVKHRKAMKSELTAKALELTVKNLQTLSNKNSDTAIAIIEQSIMRGWKGVFELKQETNGKPKRMTDAERNEKRLAELLQGLPEE